jgi:hypothetical protein
MSQKNVIILHFKITKGQFFWETWVFTEINVELKPALSNNSKLSQKETIAYFLFTNMIFDVLLRLLEVIISRLYQYLSAVTWLNKSSCIASHSGIG